MNRYIVFGGDIYYAGGGAIDYLVDLRTKSDALQYRRTYLAQRADMRWCHIFDTKNVEIIPIEEDEHGAVEGHH